MKLAEALIERADIQKRLCQLSSRLAANARVQEGEKPSEDPSVLLGELEALTDRLNTLITRINLTNAAVIDCGETVTALIARRDCIRRKSDMLRNFLDEASIPVMRGTRSEVVIRSTVSVAELRKKCDTLSVELRELDVRIQSLNWTTELI